MSKYIFRTVICALMVGVLPVSVIAGDFDGSKAMVCASVHATECDAETQECISGAPWMINFPVFTEINFETNTLSTTPQHKVERISKIAAVNHLPNGQMSVQGTDGDFAWSMLVSEESGSMTLTTSGEEVGFIVFGACTIR